MPICANIYIGASYATSPPAPPDDKLNPAFVLPNNLRVGTPTQIGLWVSNHSYASALSVKVDLYKTPTLRRYIPSPATQIGSLTQYILGRIEQDGRSMFAFPWTPTTAETVYLVALAQHDIGTPCAESAVPPFTESKLAGIHLVTVS